ncbi:hypothetical protein GCM10020295_04920 [Streptomyces cinereospinus]
MALRGRVGADRAAAVALVVRGGSGATAVAFAGGPPLAISGDRAEPADESAGPGAAEDAAIEPAPLTEAGPAALDRARARSALSVPVLGPMALTIAIRRGTASDPEVEAGAVAVGTMSPAGAVGTMSPAGAGGRVPLTGGAGGPFRLTVGEAAGERLALRAVSDAADAAGHPVRGVVHAAVHLDDATPADLAQTRIRAVLAPEVQGTPHPRTDRRAGSGPARPGAAGTAVSS